MQHKAVLDLVTQLTEDLKAKLGSTLLGVSIYGSLTTEDFDPALSDIDLLVVTATDLTAEQLTTLDALHHRLLQQYPIWNNRLEIAYFSKSALQNIKTTPATVAIISPGEPFHIKAAGNDWIINCYLIQEQGITVLGPKPTELIEPISHQEFVNAVRQQVAEWKAWIINTKGSSAYQAYAILTLCRALHVIKTGQQTSKQKAAVWAAQQLPTWSHIITAALQFQKQSSSAPKFSYIDTINFTHAIDTMSE